MEITIPSRAPSGYERQATLEYALKVADKAFGR